MTLAKKLTGTLTAGSTTIIFTDELINNDSIIEVYTQSDNVYPADITQAGNSVTILFDRQSVNVGVAIMIINLTQLDEPGDIALTNLSDVTITSLASNQMLIWNGTKWVNADLPSIPTIPDELNDLTDVVITSPAANQVLTYDGDEWVNSNVASGVNYSTTEQVIGTWIDGKPLYQITYEYTNTGLSSTTDIITLSSEIVVRDIKGVLCNTDGRIYLLPYSKGSSTTAIIVTADNKIEIVLNSDSWGSSYTPIYITIQYTKTTD